METREETSYVATCVRCGRAFAHKSSLVRHTKRCLEQDSPLLRRKACEACSAAKARCDLSRPTCSRCRLRSLSCHFSGASLPTVTEERSVLQEVIPRLEHRINSAQLEPRHTDSLEHLIHIMPSTTSSSDTGRHTDTFTTPSEPPFVGDSAWPKDIQSGLLHIDEGRRRRMLESESGLPRSPVSATTRHAMRFIIRVLKSWPRALSQYATTVSPSFPAEHMLPCMIHPLQLIQSQTQSSGISKIPPPLANGITLVKMWVDHAPGSASLVQSTVLNEVHRLLREYGNKDHYTDSDNDNVWFLLAAAQSLTMLLIILLFGLDDTTVPPLSAQDSARLITDSWDLKERLTATGLMHEHEMQRVDVSTSDNIFVPPQPPTWKEWVLYEAKRRTVFALYHIDWAWSIQHSYPMLTCFELAPLPSPSPGYLWHAIDETRWQRLYVDWLRRWGPDQGGPYRTVEFFHIEALDALDVRSESWLAESDELGMMLMAELNTTSDIP